MNKKKIAIVSVFVAVLILACGFYLSKNPQIITLVIADKTPSHEIDSMEHDDHNHHEIKLTTEQLKRFDIQTMKVTQNNFQYSIILSGQIALNENEITNVVSSVPGVVKDIFKGLGENIKVGEPLATLQSRDMAEAKSAFIIAHKTLDLKRNLLEREEKLVKEKMHPEVLFIQTRNNYENANIELEQARQKLLALGMNEKQIQSLSDQKTPLNLYSINSPLEGTIIARDITRGEVISDDKQVFVIANLNTVWVNLAVPVEELSKIKKDQDVVITAHQGKSVHNGIIMYVSPVISEESRSGRAIVQLNNTDRSLYPGDFVKAQVVVSKQSNCLSLPNAAMQKIDGESCVFIKTAEDLFEAKPIQIKGSENRDFIEILNGISEGDEVVIKNTFALKAELGKNEAEHDH